MSTTDTTDRQARHDALLARIPEGVEMWGVLDNLSGSTIARRVSHEGWGPYPTQHPVKPWAETDYRVTDFLVPLPAPDDGERPVDGERGWVAPLTEDGQQRFPDGTIVQQWVPRWPDAQRAVVYVSGTGYDVSPDAVGDKAPYVWHEGSLVCPVVAAPATPEPEWVDLTEEQARRSTRFAEHVYSGANRKGQRVVGLRCGFCQCVTEAALWSVAGVGKRCDCGAIFRRHNPTATYISEKAER